MKMKILIPFHLESNGGVDVKVGEKLTLEIGDRYLNGDKENRLYQDENPWLYDNSSSGQAREPEIWKQRETKTYTVSGIYERPDLKATPLRDIRRSQKWRALAMVTPKAGNVPYI